MICRWLFRLYEDLVYGAPRRRSFDWRYTRNRKRF